MFGKNNSKKMCFPNSFGQPLHGRVWSKIKNEKYIRKDINDMKEKKQKRSAIVDMNLKRILKERQAAGEQISQNKVAERMGIQPQTLVGHLKSEKISDDTIDSIAKALGVDKSELLLSEDKNKWMAFTKHRENYYRTTLRGKLLLIGSVLYLGVVVLLYNNTIVSGFGSLLFVLMLEVFGFWDPIGDAKPNLLDVVFRWILRILAITMSTALVLYPIALRLAA